MNLSIMIKPASSLCNLRCRYCFYHDLAENRDVANYGVMSDETRAKLLERAFEALPEGRNTLSLIFQGGEPMIAGLPFFEKLEDDIRRLGRRDVAVHRCVQTNGTLIDDEWAAFFARHRYLLGVSLDGPAEIQNALRVDASGKGSFSRVQAGIACLKRHGVDYNILSVVSADVARHGRKVYGFFRKNGWDYIQFIPCMDPIDGRREPFSLSPAQYGRFLIETFGLYEQELLRGVRVSVRWFDNLIALAAGYPPESCGMTGVCACHFVMEADGSVYPCDFYVDDAHWLGNVYDTGFREMFDCETARAFVRESMQANEKCRACRWFSLCRGGCRRYRDPAEGGAPGEGNVLGLNRLCEAYEIFFSECADRVVRLAQRMKE